MSRVAARIELTEAESKELERRERAHSTPYRDRQRAKVILLASAGLENQQIAGKLKLSRMAVGKWRERFSVERIAGLVDAPGRGRLSNLEPEQMEAVLSRVVQPPAHLRRWSCRTMAQESGLSKSTVQKLWASNDLKPHLSRTFKLSTDPQFEVKFWDIVGLYLNPPDRALVLCCDEKSQIQALSRSQPGLPLKAGHIQTRTHDYYRNGTVTLFAALDYLQGKIIARTDRRHTHREWLRFLKHIDEQTPADVQLHLIVDNYSTHKTPAVKRWIKAHPRFHLHLRRPRRPGSIWSSAFSPRSPESVSAAAFSRASPTLRGLSWNTWKITMPPQSPSSGPNLRVKSSKRLPERKKR